MNAEAARLYGMGLHDREFIDIDEAGDDTTRIFRVAGGWIYEFHNNSRIGTVSRCVFVPFSDEFMTSMQKFDRRQKAKR